MSFLVDTHILIWWLVGDPRLSTAARRALTDGAHEVLVSAVTVAEIAIKRALGKLDTDITAAGMIAASGFTGLSLTAEHAARLERLPWHHRDPFDRMLIAQAQHERCIFITADERCRAYDVAIL